MARHTIQELHQYQALTLEQKIEMTKERIKAWVDHYGIDGVYVSFSSGKDSTVLLHIARQLYPTIKAVFVDVPTQYPEMREYAKNWGGASDRYHKAADKFYGSLRKIWVSTYQQRSFASHL